MPSECVKQKPCRKKGETGVVTFKNRNVYLGEQQESRETLVLGCMAEVTMWDLV